MPKQDTPLVIIGQGEYATEISESQRQPWSLSDWSISTVDGISWIATFIRWFTT